MSEGDGAISEVICQGPASDVMEEAFGGVRPGGIGQGAWNKGRLPELPGHI